jgi:serine/threonine-protein kinase
MGAEDRSSSRPGRDTLHDTERPPAAFSETLASEVHPRPPAGADGGSTDPDRRATDPDRDEPAPTEDAFGDLSTGAELGGRYRLEKVLGKGATGVVFEASHLVIGKRVALKCLYPHHRAAPNAVERFFREARIAATVEHPNVIQVFDGGDEKDTLYLTMELLKGESLGQRLDRGPLPLLDAVETFLGIMDGVAAVHARGVVHRDLKPDNIFLVEPRRAGRLPVPKVLDFGISKLKEPGLRELTTLGTVMGTPYYMAPEQIANTRDVDARADVYSLGVMLYEALSGDVPYYADSVLDIFKAAQTGGAQPLDRVRDDVPAPLARLVERAMQPERDDRWEAVAEMAEALRQIALSVPAADAREDVRRTVQDVESPLVEYEAWLEKRREERKERDARPNGRDAGARRRQEPVYERSTLPPPAQTAASSPAMPRWGWVVVGVSGAVTLASVVTALVALAS